jgi:hypothetical protein
MERHIRQEGFGAVVLLLAIIVVALVGVTGWVAYRAIATKPETKTSVSSYLPKKAVTVNSQTDITADWLTFNAPNGKYSIKIPDGWNLISLGDGSVPYGVATKDITYQQGVKATVKSSTVQEINIAMFAMGSPTCCGHKPDGEIAKTYQTSTGLQVTEYRYYYAEDSIGVTKGSTEYTYQIQDGAKSLQIMYTAEAGAPDQTAFVEKAIETVKLY